MLNNKVLLVVKSVYQLFTAVHMKRSILAEKEADLLVTDITAVLHTYIPRLKETGLFAQVIFGKTKEWNQKYAAAKGDTLDEGFQNASHTLRWMLNEELADYSEVYFSNFDPFIRMLACQFDRPSCEFIWYEDGFSTYVIDYLREDRAPINRHPAGGKIREKVRRVLLYEPHLALRGDHLINQALPKVDRNDQELKLLLNYIFDYQKPEERMDFIFLEQSFRAEGIQTNDLALMRLCQQAVGPGRFLVKPHPRNPENVPFQLGLTRKYPTEAPWELFLFNENPEHCTTITVCSNAALTSRIVFGMDVNTVMLYRLFEGKVLWKEDAILKQYLRKFRRQFAGNNYYVPQTVYELQDILTYLGGRHEPTDQSFHHYSRVSGRKLS